MCFEMLVFVVHCNCSFWVASVFWCFMILDFVNLVNCGFAVIRLFGIYRLVIVV